MNYYIIAASKDHVEIGKENGFAQAGHGKKSQLEKLNKGDWVIYYSSKDKLKDGKPYQKFTAIGQVTDTEPYQVEVNPDFRPWRRNINFYDSKDTEIKPLLEDLQFIKNTKKWGFYLMSGFVKISEQDFKLISEIMLSEIDKKNN